MTVLVVLLAVAVGVLAVIVFGLLRTHAEILRALDRLGVNLDEEAPGASPGTVGLPAGGSDGARGREAHDLVGVSPGGGPTKVSVVGPARLTLLAFLSPGCRTCRRFWEAFADPGLELPGAGTRLVVVGQDPAYDSPSAFAALVPAGMKAVMSTAAWHDYDVPGSPYFALVDGSAGRVVGAGSATRWEQVSGLLSQALDDETAGLQSRHSRAFARRRARRADEALKAAGIGPSHPSLRPPNQGDRREGRDPGVGRDLGIDGDDPAGNGSRRGD